MKKLLYFSFFYVLMSTPLAVADSMDHIDAVGKIGPEAKCIVCGGRTLCGGIEELIPLDYFNKSIHQSILKHCVKKTNEIQMAISNNRGLAETAEQDRFLELKEVVTRIAKEKAKVKNGRKPNSITQNQIQGMLQFRLNRGFPYSDLKHSLKSLSLEHYENANLVLPLLSFANFKSKGIPNKKVYTGYVESLMVTEPYHLYKRFDGLVMYTDKINGDSLKSLRSIFKKSKGGSAGPLGGGASAKISEATGLNKKQKRQIANESRTQEQSNEYVNGHWVSPYDPKTGDINPDQFEYNYNKSSDTTQFLQNAIFKPEFHCREAGYAQNRIADQNRIANMAKEYGGASTIEQSLRAKNLHKEYTSAINSKSVKDCIQRLNRFFKNSVASLPNLRASRMVKTAYDIRSENSPGRRSARLYARLNQPVRKHQRFIASDIDRLESKYEPTNSTAAPNPGIDTKPKPQNSKSGKKLVYFSGAGCKTCSTESTLPGEKIKTFYCTYDYLIKYNTEITPSVCSLETIPTPSGLEEILPGQNFTLSGNAHTKSCYNHLLLKSALLCVKEFPEEKWIDNSQLFLQKSGTLSTQEAQMIIKKCKKKIMEKMLYYPKKDISLQVIRKQFAKLRHIRSLHKHKALYCEKLYHLLSITKDPGYFSDQKIQDMLKKDITNEDLIGFITHIHAKHTSNTFSFKYYKRKFKYLNLPKEKFIKRCTTEHLNVDAELNRLMAHTLRYSLPKEDNVYFTRDEEIVKKSGLPNSFKLLTEITHFNSLEGSCDQNTLNAVEASK